MVFLIMSFENIILEFVIIFVGASVFATIFLYMRQSVILAYIFLGMLIGPWGLGYIKNPDYIDKISHIGIILLLFLIGLELHPERLYKLFKKMFFVTLGTCIIFALISFLFCITVGFSISDSLIIGLSLMFSSTVISLKMLPEDALEHKHIGEMMTGVLLLQDILAVLVIIIVRGGAKKHFLPEMLLLMGKLALMVIISFLFVKYLLSFLFEKFESVNEYSFVLSLGWCLMMGEMANIFGFSYELGAFIAGISISMIPAAHVIDEKLKPVREFFLILFFFSIGAKFDLLVTMQVLVPGIILAIILLVVKPLIFLSAFKIIKEKKIIARQLSFRLGQCSEFSMLVAFIAFSLNKISPPANYLIQLVTIITFIVSTFLIAVFFPEKNKKLLIKKKMGKKSWAHETTLFIKSD